MKNLKFALALVALTATQANALNSNGATAWAGIGCSPSQNQTAPGFRYCWTNYTSATTAAQLGTISTEPSRHQFLVVGISGSAVAGLVTPTVSLKLGTRTIATINVSATTAGNVVDLGNVAYFNGLSVSTSVPSTISSTNSLLFSVIENEK